MANQYIIPQISALSLLVHNKGTTLTDHDWQNLIERTVQDDCPIFYQARKLMGRDQAYLGDEESLYDVFVYIDFSGIFDRKPVGQVLELQKKAEALFRPEGVELDIRFELKHYVAFERSASMGRANRLAFVRKDIYEKLQEPVGLARILTILARGYLFHDADGALLSGSPYDRADLARRARCAWCSVPENKKSPEPPVDFRALSTEFPELVDDKGRGWYYRHVKAVIAFVRSHTEETDQWTQKKIDPISAHFTKAWKKKVRQMQVPVFHRKTKGAWIHRFDDMIADALEAGPLRTEEYLLPDEYWSRIEEVISDDKLKPVAAEVVRFYLANRSDDTPWVVLPVQSFDAYYGSTAFSKKQLAALPKELILREYRDGVCRICLADGMISTT